MLIVFKADNKNKLKEFIAGVSTIQKEIRDGMSIKVRNFNALIDKHKKVNPFIFFQCKLEFLLWNRTQLTLRSLRNSLKSTKRAWLN